VAQLHGGRKSDDGTQVQARELTVNRILKMAVLLIALWGGLVILAATHADQPGEKGPLIFKAVAVPGAVGHPTGVTDSYSMPVVVDGSDVYVAYLGNDSKTTSYILKFSGKAGKWSEPVRLGSGARYDNHHYPNLVMDREGYLHAFYGCHHDPLRYRRSERPRDISAWTAESNPLSTATYPRPFVLKDGSLLVLLRRTGDGGLQYGHIQSRDRGKTWSNFQTLIDGPGALWDATVSGAYIEEKDGQSPVIHLAWSWWNAKLNPMPFYYEDVVYVKFPLAEKSWQSADGKTRALPLSYEQAAPIRKGKKLYVEDMTLDASGHPVLVFSKYALSGEDRSNERTFVATYDREWKVEEPLPGTVLSNSSIRITCAGGSTTIVGNDASGSRGLVLAQRKNPSDTFLRRNLFTRPEREAVHPVIVPDLANQSFHIVWTGYKAEAPGQLMYGTAPIILLGKK
jgi:hypothetical protein